METMAYPAAIGVTPAAPAAASGRRSERAGDEESAGSNFTAALDQARGEKSDATRDARQAPRAGEASKSRLDGRARTEAKNETVATARQGRPASSRGESSAEKAPEKERTESTRHDESEEQAAPAAASPVAPTEPQAVPVPCVPPAPVEPPMLVAPEAAQVAITGPPIGDAESLPTTDAASAVAPPVASVPAKPLPAGILAQDAVRSPGPPAVGVRARAAAEEAPAEVGTAVAPPTPGEEATEAAEVQQSPSPAAPAVGAAAGLAYRRAARALDGAGWPAQALKAATVAVESVADQRAASTANPPIGEAGASERPTTPALSAHAAAIFRSLAAADRKTDPESSDEATAADTVLPPSDLMESVAIEFAAAGFGDQKRDSEQSQPWSRREEPRRSAGAADALTSRPPAFWLEQAAATAGGTQGSDASGGTATAPPVEPAAADVPSDVPIAGQIVKAVALAWRDGVGEAKIRLTPEHLGEVLVTMKVDRGQVVAQVAAETGTARAWIETHQQELRDSLAQQGLHLGRFVVTSDGQRQGQPQDDGAERQRRQQPRPRPGATQPRFELTV